jgi:hypothetical protein
LLGAKPAAAMNEAGWRWDAINSGLRIDSLPRGRLYGKGPSTRYPSTAHASRAIADTVDLRLQAFDACSQIDQQTTDHECS